MQSLAPEYSNQDAHLLDKLPVLLLNLSAYSLASA